jgi:hypothetical protein
VIAGERVNILPAVVAAIRAGTITRERLQLDAGPLVVSLPDGRRVELDSARLQMIIDVLVELLDQRALEAGVLRLVKLDAVRVPALPGFTWEIGPRLRALADRLRDGPIAMLAPPSGLTATLRDYQCRGLSWLQWLREGGLGGIRHQFVDELDIRLSQLATVFWREFEAFTGSGHDFEERGYLFIAETAEGLAELREPLDLYRRLGLAVEMLDRADIERLVPGIRTDDLAGGRICAADGYGDALAALAGFVPCADEGISTTLRCASPRSRCHA